MRRSLAIAVLPIALSCSGTPDSFKVDGSGGVNTCPPATSNTPGARVSPRVGRVTLRLPPAAYRSRVEYNRDRIGETWTIGSEVRVSWELSRAPTPVRQLTPDDVHQLACREVIGGEPVDIVTFFGTATYVPGQYVVATWPRARGRTLTVESFASDSSRLADMLSIIRSVRRR